jgi:hypothetical protein
MHTPAFPTGCVTLHVPREACQVWFTRDSVNRTEEIGRTARDEIMIASFDAQGRVVAIELVGPGKPCQVC